MTSLFVPPKFASGLAGAKLTFTQTGTSTLQNTYTDEALTVASSNPVMADASGVFAPIYFDPTLPSYRVKYTTSANVLIYQVDGVPSNQNTGATLRLQSTDPYILLYDTDGTVNVRKYRIRLSGQTFDISYGNDAESSFTSFFSYNPASGAGVTIAGGTPLYGSYAKKLNDSTITSSATLASDPDLALSLESGYMYVVEGQISFDADTGQGAMGAKFGFNYSGGLNTGLTANVSQFVNGTGAVALSAMSTVSPLVLATIGDTAGSNQIRFTIYYRVTTLGTLTLQRCQNSSNGAVLAIRQGSWIRAHRIGTVVS